MGGYDYDTADVSTPDSGTEARKVYDWLAAPAICPKKPEKYTLLFDAYNGTGGFETGSYLVPHPREGEDKYLRRKMMAYYINNLRPVLLAQVNPIFKVLPERTFIGSGGYYEEFIKNVDTRGTSLNTFMKVAAEAAKLDGVTFVIMDMQEIAENALVTKQMVLEKRLFPYVYNVHPSKVKSWAVDKFGQITYFQYDLKVDTIDNDGNKSTHTETHTWTETMYIFIGEDGKPVKKKNKLGIVPVIPVYGATHGSQTLIPQSEMFPIAQISLAIYNASSELRERNRNQAFSMIVYPVGEDDDFSTAKEIVVGTTDMLVFKQGPQSPKFITPEATSSDIITNEINMMMKELYRMANLQLTTGVQTQASGLAKEWDNMQLFQTIDGFAQELESAEKKILALFNRYTGETIQATIAYNNQFGIIDPTISVNIATQALALNISPEYNLEIKKKVVRDTLKDQDDEIIKRVLADLESDPSARNPILMSPTVNSYAKQG